MAERSIEQPGPEHPITVEPTGARVRVLVAGEVIADSISPLVLREAGHPPVHYLPRADVRMERLEPSDHTTWCPYKGEASYFSIRGGGRDLENAAWTYEAAAPAVGAIRGFLAFYGSKVEALFSRP